MALVIVTTAGSASANSYASVAEAETYHLTKLYNTLWDDAEVETKTAALVWATRVLDEQVEWAGNIMTNTQALRWPRGMVLDRDQRRYLDQLTIPSFLKNATAEFARHLLTKDRFQVIDDSSGGITSVQAGSVNVTFDSTGEIEVLPPSIFSLIAPYILGSASGIEVGLMRV